MRILLLTPRVKTDLKQVANKYLPYFLLLSISYFPLFSFLDTLPLRLWDESRLAVSALEMKNDGNFIVTTYEGQPDTWNSKPPLMIWCQVACMWLVGPNELAVRLPSAIAALLTSLAIMVFLHRETGKPWLGFIAALVLITSPGYVTIHGTRTGDYDSLLTLFTTLSALTVFRWIQNQNLKDLYFFFLFLAFGVLTKSIAALLFIPGILVFALWQGKLRHLLGQKHFYPGLLLFLLIVSAYYFSREVLNPGYLKAVFENELGGRFLSTIETHQHPFWFYASNLIDFQFNWWAWFIPGGILAGLTSRQSNIRTISRFAILLALTFFLIISSGQTKLQWYDLPLYPFLSILVALFLYPLLEFIKEINFFKQNWTPNPFPLVFAVFVFFTPYFLIFEKSYKPKEKPSETELFELSYFFQESIKGRRNINGMTFIHEGYNSHILFYIKALEINNIRVIRKNWNNVQAGEKVILNQPELREALSQKFRINEIYKKGNVSVLSTLPKPREP